MSRFVLTDRKAAYLLPPSADDWLAQNHLARFVVEVIDGLALSGLSRQYAGRGSKAHHPATFRRRFLDDLADLFVQVLEMAHQMKLLRMGTVCLDGTKISSTAKVEARAAQRHDSERAAFDDQVEAFSRATTHKPLSMRPRCW